jgi:hypothetical protein
VQACDTGFFLCPYMLHTGWVNLAALLPHTGWVKLGAFQPHMGWVKLGAFLPHTVPMPQNHNYRFPHEFAKVA